MLHAWHSWVLRELDLFKSKFRGAAATLLGAGDCRGFSLGAPTWGMAQLGLGCAVQTAVLLVARCAASYGLPLAQHCWPGHDSCQFSLSATLVAFRGLECPTQAHPPRL